VDPQVLAGIAIVAPCLAGLVIGRAWVLVLPFATVPIFYLGLLASWWGAGVGDGWEYAFGLCIGLGVLASAAGAALGSLRVR
jgi:hypothetical protein